MERSPALPLLSPCPLPHPIPQASVCGFGEGVNGPGASKGCKPGDHSCLLPPCSCIPGRCDLRQALDFYKDFPSPSSFGSHLPFQAPCLPYLCSARLPVARSLPSLLRPHLPAACSLPKCLLPDPLRFPLSSAGSRTHSCLLSPHLPLWSFLVSSEVAADSVCGSGGLCRLTLQT